MTKKGDLSPTSLMMIRKIGGVECRKLLRVLFDSGGTKTMINKRVLPPEAQIITKQDQIVQTANGSFNANKFVKIRDLFLPEFDKSKRIYGKTLQIFDNPNSSHDIILGRDYLLDLGIVVDFEKKMVRWDRDIVPMKDSQHWQHHTNWTLALDKDYLMDLDEDEIEDDSFILDAKYEPTSAEQVARQQKHLTPAQQNQLAEA